MADFPSTDNHEAHDNLGDPLLASNREDDTKHIPPAVLDKLAELQEYFEIRKSDKPTDRIHLIYLSLKLNIHLLLLRVQQQLQLRKKEALLQADRLLQDADHIAQMFPDLHIDDSTHICERISVWRGVVFTQWGDMENAAQSFLAAIGIVGLEYPESHLLCILLRVYSESIAVFVSRNSDTKECADEVLANVREISFEAMDMSATLRASLINYGLNDSVESRRESGLSLFAQLMKWTCEPLAPKESPVQSAYPTASHNTIPEGSTSRQMSRSSAKSEVVDIDQFLEDLRTRSKKFSGKVLRRQRAGISPALAQIGEIAKKRSSFVSVSQRSSRSRREQSLIANETRSPASIMSRRTSTSNASQSSQVGVLYDVDPAKDRSWPLPLATSHIAPGPTRNWTSGLKLTLPNDDTFPEKAYTVAAKDTDLTETLSAEEIDNRIHTVSGKRRSIGPSLVTLAEDTADSTSSIRNRLDEQRRHLTREPVSPSPLSSTFGPEDWEALDNKDAIS